MRIAIRADASREIGHGHVMRCLALAEALRDRGAEVCFLCRALPGDARTAIHAAGYGLIAISAESCEADAQACCSALAATAPFDWLIVDHYRLDAGWGRAVRPVCRKLMAIDDLADRPLDCDLLLDQNWHDAPERRYGGRIPDHAITLFGPRWALLRGEFARMRAMQRPRDGQIRRILVCFGGSDAPNATDAVLAALSDCQRIVFDVVVGAGNPHAEMLRAHCSRLPAASLAINVSDMAVRMADADLFIGAGGGMTWERASLGLPGITLPIADNQLELCAALAAVGEGVDLGSPTPQALLRLPERLADLIRNADRVMAMSAALANRCDGSGVLRVCERLFAMSSDHE